MAVLSGAISSRFLCPRPPFLLCAPNQNHHVTQATFPKIQAWAYNRNSRSQPQKRRMKSLYRHDSNSLTLSNASELFWSWSSINHIQIDKEKENFVIACLRPSQAGIVKREIRHVHVVVVQWRQRNVQKGDVFCFVFCYYYYLVLPCQAIAFLTFLCKLDCSCW